MTRARLRARRAWSRARRPLGVVLKIAALVAVVYEVALNAFLMTGGLGALLSGNPDVILVEYAAGWSLVPGVVHARALRIRSKDGHVEFDLHIERCVFRVALTELARKHFHVRWVHGRGISFRLRTRMEPNEATEEVVAALPPIDGLEPIPLLGPDEPPPDDAHYNLVTFQLDDIDAEDVREIWFGTLRYEGEAHATGRFYLRPIRWANVGPATLDIRTGRLSMGPDRLLEDITGRLDPTVDGFDPRVTHGASILRDVSVHAAIEGDIPSLAFVHRFLPAPDVRVTGGAGHLTLDARVDHGRIAPASRARAETRGARVELPKGAATANTFVSIDTRPATPDGESLEGAVTFRDVRVATRGFEPNPASIDRADVGLRTTELDLAAHPFSDAAISARVPVVQIPDARLVDPWLDEGGNVRVQAGHGTLGADVALDRGTAHGTLAVALDGVEVAIGREMTITGELRARAQLRRWNLASGRIDLSGTRVEVLHVAAPGRTGDWWANVELPASDVDLHAGPVWRSHVVAQARDTRPFAGAILAQKKLPEWLTPLATAGDLRLGAQIDVGFGDGAIEVTDLGATAGAFRVRASFSQRADASHLVALVGAGVISVGVESDDGNTHFELAPAGAWYDQHAPARSPR